MANSLMQNRLNVLLALGAIGVFGATTVRALQTRTQLTGTVVRLDSTTYKLRFQKLRADVMEEVLKNPPMPRAFANADPALARLAAADSVTLVYWVSPDCPSCRSNYQTLEHLAARFPNRLIAVTTLGTDSIAADYARMKVPLVRIPDSSAVGIFPSNTFPVTLLMRGPRRVRYTIGKLNEDTVAIQLSGAGRVTP